jgi:hypothetical protein
MGTDVLVSVQVSIRVSGYKRVPGNESTIVDSTIDSGEGEIKRVPSRTMVNSCAC